MGGGDVVRQCVDDGLADELVLHLAPIVLGAGTPLFPTRPVTSCASVRSASHRTRPT